MPHLGLYFFAQILPSMQWAGEFAVVSPVCLVLLGLGHQFLVLSPGRGVFVGNQRFFALVVAVGERLGSACPQSH